MEEKRFLSRLIRMYGDDNAKMLYKVKLNQEVTDDMLEEARKICTDKEESGFNLNLM